MNYKCINNHDLEGILTLNKEYKGDVAFHLDYIKIYRCDDKKGGYFRANRFVEVPDTVSVVEPQTKVNQYFLYAEKS